MVVYKFPWNHLMRKNRGQFFYDCNKPDMMKPMVKNIEKREQICQMAKSFLQKNISFDQKIVILDSLAKLTFQQVIDATK